MELAARHTAPASAKDRATGREPARERAVVPVEADFLESLSRAVNWVVPGVPAAWLHRLRRRFAAPTR